MNLGGKIYYVDMHIKAAIINRSCLAHKGALSSGSDTKCDKHPSYHEDSKQHNINITVYINVIRDSMLSVSYFVAICLPC